MDPTTYLGSSGAFVDRALARYETRRQPGKETVSSDRDDTYAKGMEVRRAVLGDAHVDRAIERTTPFTEGFQELITRYAWGEVWSRPGLDRRARSMITLTALVATGREHELEMHVRAALQTGSRQTRSERCCSTAPCTAVCPPPTAPSQSRSA